MKLGIRELVLLTVMVGLLGATWWFGLKKGNERATALRIETAAKQAQLVELREATADVEDLSRRIEDLQKAIDFFEGKLPREKEVEKILRDVWEAAERNRLEIRSFEPMTPERGSHYGDQPIKLQLAGDFEGFYSYMLEIESLKRITRVTKMELTKMQEQNGSMEAELVLNIFFEPTKLTPMASAN